jgi:LysR family transcriptional regulator for bpeEF and oprC
MPITHLGSIPLLIAIADAKSLAAAAHRLSLSPSAVSKALARLERDVGTRLVSRNTHHLALTENGARLYEHFRRIAAEIEQSEMEVLESRTAVSGRIRVQLPTAFGRKIALPQLARFVRDYPNLGVDIEMSDRIIDLSKERVDVSVRFNDVGGPRLVARKLCTIRYVPCASPAYLEQRGGEPRTPDDLDRHRCLNYFIPQARRPRDWQFMDKGERFSKPISGPLNFNNLESLLEAAIAGLGIVMMPTFLVADAVRSGRMRVILRDYIAPGEQVYAVCLPHEAASPRVKAFTAFLRSAITAEVLCDDLADLPPRKARSEPSADRATRKANVPLPRARR